MVNSSKLERIIHLEKGKKVWQTNNESTSNFSANTKYLHSTTTNILEEEKQRFIPVELGTNPALEPRFIENSKKKK